MSFSRRFVGLPLAVALIASTAASAQTAEGSPASPGSLLGGGGDAFAVPSLSVANNTAPQTPQRPKLTESVAAIVNDEVISSYDLRQRMRLLVATSGVQPTADNLPQIQREALRNLVDEHLEMSEIHDVEVKQKDLKLEPTDKEINDRIAEIAGSAGIKPEQFLATLRSDDVDVQTLKDEIRAQLAWERYIGARFRDNVEISDNQIRAAMERANAEASKPQYLVSEIFIDAARVGNEASALEGARQLIAQMQQGAPFPSVARQFSNAPTAANGGDLGWVTSDALQQPELTKAIEEMRPGQLSQPIASSEGVYILALRDKRAGVTDTVVDLKQAAISLQAGATPEEVSKAEAKLMALRGKLDGCDNLETRAAKTPGVLAGDLGETDVKDLRPSFQQAIANLKIGQVSEPVRTDIGLHLIMVCERHAAGSRAITRASIESRLEGEQYDMYQRRFLRDLRNSATIETR
jgi:peptidyl-prolyl cis-trans isomerase SurA